MSTPQAFMSATEIRTIAGRESSKALPDEDADTLPVPVRWSSGTALLIMYYRELGPPGKRVVSPPHHALYLEGGSGRVLKFTAATPQSLGIADPTRAVPGVGIPDGMAVDEFIKKRDRLLAISAPLWTAFAARTSATAPAVQPLAKEYWSLFAPITKKEVAPFYVQAAPDFFAWLELARAVSKP